MTCNRRLALVRPAALLALGLVCLSSPALSQQPTSEQTNALRANCRSDFMSKCSSVKPGGVEAFQCLKRNVASLSAGCQSAVNAIGGGGGAAPAPAQAAPAAPARPAPPPAAAAPAAIPSSPPPAASAPPTARPAPAAAAPAQRPAAPKPAAAAPKPAVAAAPPAPAALPPVAAPQLSQQEEDTLMRRSCALDYRRFCRGVQIGGGRVIACLNKHGPDLSSPCQAAIKVVGPR